MSVKTLLASTICGLAILIAQPTPMKAAIPTIAGSWQITLTPTTPPAPPVITVPGLATFISDGSVIETDGTQVVPGPSATFNTPGHGIWQLSPALVSYYIQYISVVVNPNTSLHAKNTTTMTVTPDLTGTIFTGNYTTVTVDPTGHTIKTVKGTVSGQLIPHPLLP